MVARHHVQDLNHLRGKRIALEKNTTAHSFLLISLDLAGLKYDDVEVVAAKNNRHAADLFVSGAVDAAIVWIDEDERCLRVPGSHRLETTEDASYLIAESLVVKERTLREKRSAMARLAEGWLRANAELVSSPRARRRAVDILVKAFDVRRHTAEEELKKVRFTTLGDNYNFFGDNPRYRGEKGEDLYDYFWREYEAIDATIPRKPAWRSIADDSIIRHISLTGRQHDAESPPSFKKCASGKKQRLLSKKGLSVYFPTGRSTLTPAAERYIDEEFGHLAEIYLNDCIRVEGNTDRTGPARLHKPLSKARAEAVKRHLVERYGFDARRVITVGNGDSKPVALGNRPKDLARNRRTDFLLLH